MPKKEYGCKCGETDPSKFYGHKKGVCSKCHTVDVHRRGDIAKQKAIEYLGGSCQDCGWVGNPVGFDIHHLDPIIKDSNFRGFKNWGWVRIEKEIQNCILLCAICHRIRHTN